jgi:hypothetical protein
MMGSSGGGQSMLKAGVVPAHAARRLLDSVVRHLVEDLVSSSEGWLP